MVYYKKSLFLTYSKEENYLLQSIKKKDLLT